MQSRSRRKEAAVLRKHQLFPAIYNHLIERSAGNTQRTCTQPGFYLTRLLFLDNSFLQVQDMEYFVVPTQKVPSFQDFRKSEKEVIGGLCSLANIPLTQESQRDQERRIRREIANSNERRRMQSINAGFQSLKTLIPHTDGEKLSKAAILQQTAEYIFSLEQEKTRLLQQNSQLKRFIQEYSGSSPKRRRAEDKDEGIGSPDVWEDEKLEDLKREMIELRHQLDKERSVRMMLEEQVRSLDAHMYPEKLKAIAQQVQLQQRHQEQPKILLQEEQHEPESQLMAQVLPAHVFPASTHHPTVIVQTPPPPASHQVTVVTMGPSSVINSPSTTSRQNLDTIVQAIQHIEGTQEKQEEEQRRVVIVQPPRVWSGTESDRERSEATEIMVPGEEKEPSERILP
ncbi:transcription factor AP-4 isoform X1 [Scyliorhinus canicula]|uniref:transcription factor AP-4 isoform X1 n=1 Tax=Scyliorhinus canicula TaxID=7830 RepID=UPI0018F3B7D8|nr:transcription factor AP-4 isoform X1 [Scyliorhinus canicula]